MQGFVDGANRFWVGSILFRRALKLLLDERLMSAKEVTRLKTFFDSLSIGRRVVRTIVALGLGAIVVFRLRDDRRYDQRPFRGHEPGDL